MLDFWSDSGAISGDYGLVVWMQNTKISRFLVCTSVVWHSMHHFLFVISFLQNRVNGFLNATISYKLNARKQLSKWPDVMPTELRQEAAGS